MFLKSGDHALWSAAATIALLTGCGTYAPATTPNGGSALDVLKQPRTASWMLPEAKQSALLYISLAAGVVNVYTYPAKVFVGQLNDLSSPEGLCSDSSGHVFVPDTFLQKVAEYAHGGTQPIKTFTLGSSQEFSPISCSIDPGTNNLAVQQDGTHNLYIFKHEKSKATAYYNPYGTGYLGGAYDASGNFFMRGGPNHISELPKGSSTFTNIKLSRHMLVEGIAWDGKYLSITNGNTISAMIDYRFHVHGTLATVVSASLLEGAEYVRQFTIYDHHFIGPDQAASEVTFWKYPAFGDPVGAIQDLTEPLGSAISVGAKATSL